MQDIDVIDIVDVAVDVVVPGIPGVDIPGPEDLVAGITEGLLDLFFINLGDALVSSATFVNELVFGVLNSSTTVDLATLQGSALLAMTTALGVAMVLAFFFASIIRGLISGEYSAIARAALVDVPMALVGTLGLVAFAQILLGITDAATQALLGEASADLGESTLAALSNPEGGVAYGLVGGLVIFIYIVGALFTWMWLFLRSALIYFIIAAAPLGLATRAFPPAAMFARRTIEMAVALIVSKFFLAVALSIGATQFNEGATGEAGLSRMIGGATMMVLAAFMPSVVLKLIPIAEGATATAGVERAPLRMAAAAGGIAVGAATSMAIVGGAGAGGAAGGGGGGGVGGQAGPSDPQPPAPGGGTQSTAAPSSVSGSSDAKSGDGSNSPGGSGGSGGSGSGGSPGGSGADGADGVSVESIGGGGVGTVSGTPASNANNGSGSFGDL